MSASPELTTILPRGGQRGTEIVVEFTGDRLADAADIVFHEPGISVIKMEPAQKVVKATLKIEIDCPLGEHAMRVRTATGLSPLRTFWVSSLPIVNEKEPNNNVARPQTIPLNCTIHGSIGNEDVDHFAVEVKKGQRLTVELEAMRLGGGFFDARVSILDARRNEFLIADDTPLTAQDPVCSQIVPEDGVYIIRVREAAMGNGDQYRMHVGTMPRPLAVYPPGGRPGEELEVTFLGDPRGPVKRRVQLPTEFAPERFSLSFDDADGVAPSPLPFRISTLPNIIEAEPNDGPKEATPVDSPCAFNGVIDKARDIDYFKFHTLKGQVCDIRAFARKIGSPLDAVLWIGTVDGKIVSSSDDNEGSPDGYIRFTAPEERDYFVGIRDHLYRGGSLFVYRIEVTPIQPRVELSLQRVAEPPSQERLAVTVPKGNRMAALLNVRRVDGGGPLRLDFAGMPDNVTATAELVPPNQTSVPVLFEATNDASTACSLTRLTAKPSDEGSPIPSRFEQPIVLVYYANQTVFHSYRSEQLPVAVADAAPFHVSIVEPKAPLVRGGTMQLKIVAERIGDFKGPIRIQPLYNPAGVSAPGETTIPEGKSEITLPLTANANAGIGKWKYAVIGVGDIGGAMRVSSQLATIDVAQPFVQIALDRTKADQGGTGSIRGKVTVATSFEGTAKIQLLGLPPKVKSEELEITAETKEISFPLTVDATCNPGPIRNLFCQVTLTHNGEPVVQNSGTTELRVDAPLKKNNASNTKATAKPQ